MKSLLACLTVLLFVGWSLQQCCQKQQIAGEMYDFVKTSADATQPPFNCKDDCIYSKAGNASVKYCLANGDLEAQCMDSAAKCVCGAKKPEKKIVGGTQVEPFEYPWFAAISFSADGNPVDYGCGGTLVAEEWVISAAHCYFKKDGSQELASDIKVVMGSHDRKNTSATGRRKVFNVEKIINHENYNKDNSANDIALLKLAEKADLTVYSPACMPSVDVKFDGKTGFVYGFGTLMSGGTTPDILLEVDLDIVNRTTCIEGMGDNRIFDGMLCAGGVEGKDACQGDSGGPFTVEGPTGHHILVGAVSFGDGCAQAGRYGVFADVAFYRPWLENQMKANGGFTYCS